MSRKPTYKELERRVKQLDKKVSRFKHVEDELKLQGAIVKNMAEGVCLVRVEDAAIVYANPRFERMFGYEPGELNGKPVNTLNYEDDSKTSEQVALEIIQKLTDHGEAVYEVQNVKKDGTPFWCEAHTLEYKHPEYGRVWVAVHTDITDRKRAEEALRVGEEKYRYVVENLNEGIWIIDKDSYTTFVNPRMAEMLGYTADEMIGSQVFSFMDEAEIETCKRHLERRKKGIKESHDFEFLRKDGTRIYMTLEAAPITDNDGEYAGGIAGVMDITARKRAEDALRESKEFAENLVTSMKDGFSILDNKGVHLNVNPAFCQMTGFMREELIGTGPPHLYWPEEEYEKIEMAFQKTLTGAFEDFELIFKRKNGERFPVIVSPAQTLDKKGNVTSIFATVKDITARKQAEEAVKTEKEKLNNIVRGIGAGLSLLDADTRIIWCNDILRKWFGPDAKILGKHCFELYDLKNPQEECAALLTLSTGEIELGEAFGHTIKGEEKYFQVIATPIRNEAGRIVQLLELSLDITEREQAERALRKKDAELETKAKSLEEVNTALRVLLKQREEDKTELEEKVLSNVKDLVLPHLEKLKKISLNSNQKSCVDILESNLSDIISPFARRLSSKYLGLTPTEIRVANLVKDGMTTKEIAEFMNLSCRTVETHRDNIRKKMGIKHKKTNLRTYLSSLH